MFDDLEELCDAIDALEGKPRVAAPQPASPAAPPAAPGSPGGERTPSSCSEAAPPRPQGAAEAGPAALQQPPARGSRLGLSLAQALALQAELRKGFAEPAFQARLRELERRFGKAYEAAGGEAERSQLFLSVQAPLLPSYGFEASQAGVLDMLAAAATHNGHEEFERNRLELNRLLGLAPAEGELPRCPEAAAERPSPFASQRIGGKASGKARANLLHKGFGSRRALPLSADIVSLVSSAARSDRRMGNPEEDM